MKINELRNKYFDGETSCEEERELRRFFAEEEVPEELQVYRPLFACLDQEAQKFRLEQSETEKKKTAPVQSYSLKRRRWLYFLGGAAASIALFIGSMQLFPVPNASENFSFE